MRHVAAKTSKRIQKSSFFCGKKNTHPSYCVCVCVCKGCKRMPVVTVMTYCRDCTLAYGNRCYEEPDRPFLHNSYRVCRTQCLHYFIRTPPSPHTMAKLGARERHGMLGLLLQLGYVPIVTFVIPKSPEQGPRLFCR